MISKLRRQIAVITLVTVLLTVVFGQAVFADHSPKIKTSVLALNSYHKGYKWADDIVEGIASVLGPNTRNISLQVEYMDTQRLSDARYLERLFEIYKYKFRNKKFDVIIASDDPAWNFLQKYREELFPDTPVVFCGVNYLEKTASEQNSFTGVVEGQDIKATIEVALRLHPDTKNIYVINDKTVTGNAIGRALDEAIPNFSDRVNFVSLVEYDIYQIEETVSQLPPESLVLFLIFFQDVKGQRFAYDESIARISAKSVAPIYGVWDFTLGYGIIGGMLTSGYYQGEMAAKLALRIIDGEKPNDIPIIRNSPNHYMFDSSQMKRFGVQNSALPEKSILINDSYSNKKKVLVLNSYNYGFSWTNNIIEGIKNNISSDVDLFYEFMDTKHNSGPEYIQRLYETYRHKFSNKRFDAIITSDDDAYHFLLKYHDELFADVPVIFCGVNYFQGNEITDNKLFTGIVESIDLVKTIKVALELHPAVKNIVVINDKSFTGIGNKKMLEKIMPVFPGIQFTMFEDMNMSEVQEKVAALSTDSLVLLMTFNKDKSNNVYSYEESIRLIAGKAKVPIYSVWDFYLGQGITGGMLTSGYNQGEMAANITLRVLSGEKPEYIPIVKESPNRYMFDYNYLKLFGVNLAALPGDSVVINRPISGFEKYQTTIMAGMLTVAFMLLIIQRKKVQDQLKLFATTDTLTGVLNRRTGIALLEQRLEMAKAQYLKLTICFVDVNDLKMINDTYGHHDGDNVIQSISRLLGQRLNKNDVLCRFGGDEFIIAFTDCELDQAKLKMEQIDQDINIHSYRNHKDYCISISWGFAEFNPAKPVLLDELIKLADSMMYIYKSRYKRKT